MRLLGAETVYMPCFFLPPPPYLSQNTNASQMSTPPNSSAAAPSEVVPPEPGVSTIPRYATAASGIATDDPHDARSFVLWGLTYGVVSNLVVAGGGEGFALKGPPYFRRVHMKRPFGNCTAMLGAKVVFHVHRRCHVDTCNLLSVKPGVTFYVVV